MSKRPIERYTLALLDGFKLKGPAGSVRLSSKKLIGLLAYLALTAPVPQPRDKLLTLLWGSHFDPQARQNLRQALFRLRRTLGQDALVSDGDEISLAPGVIDCDAARFARLIHDGSHASLTAAVDLYKQRLLADVVIREEAWAEWLAGERQRLEGLALDTLVTLGEAELALGHTDKALETVPRALAINNLREDAHRLMLRALAAAGRRAEALKHYEDFVALLKRELKTEPDAATKALAAELRSTPTVKAVTELARPSIAVPVAAAGRMAKVETPPAAVDEVTALMKVLVVDDHPLIREAALTMLNQLKRGTVVLEASSAQQTVEITEKHPDISLILLDITLPDRDGFSLLSELRDRYPATAIVVLSASQDQEEVQRAFSLGVLGYIPKTTRREVMLNAIELVLSGGLYIPSAVLEGERALSP
jgi:DNA-binding SARP family transcriptional activator/ActR/RegA family two-component response regulator